MKIAFLNIYQRKTERGVETFVSEVSSRLSKNHKVKVFAGNKKPQARWPVLWRSFLDPHGIQGLIWTLKLIPKIWREKYDIVIPLNGGWQSALIRLVTWLYGGKMVIAGQSGIGWDDRNNLWSFPDSFVALSKKAEKWAKKVMPLVKSVYIPNGVDLFKFKPDGEKLDIKLKPPIVLCVGAFREEKRIDFTIKAVSELDKTSLLIVGDGELKEDLEKLANKMLGKRFQINKFPFSDMPKVYRSANVFTLIPKSSEAFGIVYVEAMASNLPVVAIDDQQRREIVGNAGILVDSNDLHTYGKALKKALSTNWSEKPREQAKKFNWDNITKEYEVLFNKLLH